MGFNSYHDSLKETLALPESVVPIAYLCLGYVSHFNEKPELESANWLPRRPIDELVNFNGWGQVASSKKEQALIEELRSNNDFPQSFSE